MALIYEEVRMISIGHAIMSKRLNLMTQVLSYDIFYRTASVNLHYTAEKFTKFLENVTQLFGEDLVFTVGIRYVITSASESLIFLFFLLSYSMQWFLLIIK